MDGIKKEDTINTSVDSRWKPDFSHWYNVKLSAYQFIFEQAEKKMEEVLSESESITNKSIKMVTALVAMFTFFVGYFLKTKTHIGYNAVFIIPFIINVAGVVFLIFPKEVKSRGFLPSKLIPPKLDNEEDRDVQEEMLYYSAIVNIQHDIQFMRKKNALRAKIYLACLIWALALFCSGVVIIVTNQY